MLKKAMGIVMSLALALTITAATADNAEARRGRNAAIIGGIALGALALGAAGAYGHDRHYHRSRCYRGPKECRWVGGDCYWNRWGEEVCHGGRRKCWRPTYCD
jgi:hypothetical protein